MLLKLDIGQSAVPAGGIRLYWLGQAGFAFRMAEGRRIFLVAILLPSLPRRHQVATGC
jgi:hypothetical protein